MVLKEEVCCRVAIMERLRDDVLLEVMEVDWSRRVRPGKGLAAAVAMVDGWRSEVCSISKGTKPSR